MRKLAEQSNQFTGEISIIINDLTDKTLTGVKIMEELQKIGAYQAESVSMANNKFGGIAQAIEDMEKIINTVNTSSDEMEQKIIVTKRPDLVGERWVITKIENNNPYYSVLPGENYY